MRNRTLPGTGLLLTLAVLVAAPLLAQVDDHRDIELPPLQKFEIESPEVYELDNGLTVFLMENHELPLISVTARIRTGSVYEPADQAGLASLMGSVQRTGGAGAASGDEIDDFLEARAASVETSVSSGVGFASMSCLEDDFESVLPIFRDVLRFPRFAEDKLQIAKVQRTSAIARRNDNVLGIASREFRRLVYGLDSPLSRLTEYATLSAISRDDLVAWHDRYYHPNNVYLGVVGDFDSVAMKAALEEAFGDWARGAEFEGFEVPYRQEKAAGLYFIEKRDVTQASVRLGHLGITYDNPDYFPLQVMNEVLAGGFSGRLFKEIRSELGLAYSVGGGVGASFLYPGVTGFSLQTKSETMAVAVEALRGEIDKMIAGPVTADELKLAKDSILNSFVFNYASKGQVLGQQMLFTYYGLPSDFLERYRDRIEQVAVAEVERVARGYLHPEQFTLLVVGNPDDFDRPLSSFGEVSEIDISIPKPPTTQPKLERSAEAAAEGRAIAEKMVAALGGDDGSTTRALRATVEFILNAGGAKITMERTDLTVFPDRFHSTVLAQGMVQTSVIDGATGFRTMAGQVRDMATERVEERLLDRGRQLDFIVRYAAEVEALAGDETEVGGVACRQVHLTLWEVQSTFCVDEEGRVLKQEFDGKHPMTGAPGRFEVAYSDYRDVAGRLVSHRRILSIDGFAFGELTLQELEIDPTVDPELFNRPDG